MDQQNFYTADVLFIGATVWAAGASEALRKRGITCAVMERGQVCASEYGDALYADGSGFSRVPKTAEGASLKEELLRRGVIDGEDICLPALCPVISGRLLQSGALLLAVSLPERIEPGEGGFTVSFRSMGQLHSLRCRAVVDTTASFDTAVLFGQIPPKCAEYISAAIAGDRYGRLSVPVADHDYGEALERLVGECGNRTAKASVVPLSPVVLPEENGRTVCEGVYWMPSAAFGDPVAAYDEGARFGERFEIPETGCGTVIPQETDGGSWDVVVCGGGTAGAVAALAAAEQGGRVLLLEATTALGGMGTAGGVLGYYFGVPGGLYTKADLLAKTIRETEAVAPVGGTGDISKRLALVRLLREAGVTVSYRTTVLEALRDCDRVTGVRCFRDGGFLRFGASFVIDATAEGCVLVSAGAEMQEGRTLDGHYQPYSNVYIQENAETGQVMYRYTDNGYLDPYDPAAFGRAVTVSACDVNHLRDDYRTGLRYFGMPGLLGLREGRRIVGEENVVIGDLLSGRFTKEPAFWGYSNFDNHGKDNALEDPICRLWNTAASMWGYNMTIPIPAGALIPQGLDGILAAGRCLAVDHMTASAVRMKYEMQKSGETAGYLAMLAIRRGCKAAEVPYDVLRPLLLKSGCLDPETAPEVVRIVPKSAPEVVSRGEYWRGDPAWLHDALTGPWDSYAVWAASVHADTLRDTLNSWLTDDDPAVRRGAALALGIAGCRGSAGCGGAIPFLLSLASDKSGETPVSGRKYNYPYALAAVTILDLLQIEAAIPVVLPYVADPAYADDIPFTPCELTEDREDVRFQYFLQAFSALCGLRRNFPEKRTLITEAVEKRIFSPDFHLSVTGKGARDVRIDHTGIVRTIWRKTCAN